MFAVVEWPVEHEFEKRGFENQPTCVREDIGRVVRSRYACFLSNRAPKPDGQCLTKASFGRGTGGKGGCGHKKDHSGRGDNHGSELKEGKYNSTETYSVTYFFV